MSDNEPCLCSMPKHTHNMRSKLFFTCSRHKSKCWPLLKLRQRAKELSKLEAMKWITYFFLLFILVPIILCEFFIRTSLRHFDKHHARATRWRWRKHPSSGNLSSKLSRCCTYLVILVPFRDCVWYPSAVQPFYKSPKILAKNRPCCSMELEKLRTQLRSQLQQHQVRYFLFERAIWQTISKCYACRLGKGFCDILTTECSFMLCCCRPQVSKRKNSDIW